MLLRETEKNTLPASQINGKNAEQGQNVTTKIEVFFQGGLSLPEHRAGRDKISNKEIVYNYLLQMLDGNYDESNVYQIIWTAI